VFLDTFSFFISFQKNGKVRHWGDIKSARLFYPWRLSAVLLVCVLLSKAPQIERIAGGWIRLSMKHVSTSVITAIFRKHFTSYNYNACMSQIPIILNRNVFASDK
jgi:hypothetical protein